MSDTNETIADIIAEMRAREDLDGGDMVDNFDIYNGEYGGWDALMLIKAYADRLDAALKRERNRNFHRFATAEEAAKAWHERKFKDLCVVCAGCTFDRGPEECAPGANCEIGWLYAEAQEGGAK